MRFAMDEFGAGYGVCAMSTSTLGSNRMSNDRAVPSIGTVSQDAAVRLRGNL